MPVGKQYMKNTNKRNHHKMSLVNLQIYFYNMTDSFGRQIPQAHLLLGMEALLWSKPNLSEPEGFAQKHQMNQF